MVFQNIVIFQYVKQHIFSNRCIYGTQNCIVLHIGKHEFDVKSLCYVKFLNKNNDLKN